MTEARRNAMGAACRALADAELDAELELSRYIEALNESRSAPAAVALAPRAARR